MLDEVVRGFANGDDGVEAGLRGGEIRGGGGGDELHTEGAVAGGGRGSAEDEWSAERIEQASEDFLMAGWGEDCSTRAGVQRQEVEEAGDALGRGGGGDAAEGFAGWGDAEVGGAELRAEGEVRLLGEGVDRHRVGPDAGKADLAGVGESRHLEVVEDFAAAVGGIADGLAPSATGPGWFRSSA